MSFLRRHATYFYSHTETGLKFNQTPQFAKNLARAGAITIFCVFFELISFRQPWIVSTIVFITLSATIYHAFHQGDLIVFSAPENQILVNGNVVGDLKTLQLSIIGNPISSKLNVYSPEGQLYSFHGFGNEVNDLKLLIEAEINRA